MLLCRAGHIMNMLEWGGAGPNGQIKIRARQRSNSPGEGHYVLKIYQGSYSSRGQAGAGHASLLD